MYLPIDVQQQPEHIVTQQVQREQIRQIWAQMPAEERLLLEQKYILQCSDSELALGLGIQPQSVRMRLTRAKRRILKLLQQQSIRLEDWL